MSEKKMSKKRAAITATVCAAAILVSGSYAWILQDDITALNEFTASEQKYDVELVEDFNPDDPWANKDVTVKNTGDSPVIVRVRFEEFYKFSHRSGTTYNVEETDTPSAIFIPTSTINADKKEDSSTGMKECISLMFGDNVYTMAEWKSADKPENVWVVDTDGWCYYVRALLPDEETKKLLDKINLNKNIVESKYQTPYDLDYKVNVRLQAISADLVDFGATKNDMQWTNVQADANGNTGRAIADTANEYEITTDTTITDDARELVGGIKNTSNSFGNADNTVAVSVKTADELIAALNDNEVHGIVMANDIKLSTTDTYDITGKKLLDLGMNKLTITSTSALPIFDVSADGVFAMKHGELEYKNSDGVLIKNAGSTELVAIEATDGDIDVKELIQTTENSTTKIYGSKFENKNNLIRALTGTEPRTILINNTEILITENRPIQPQEKDSSPNVNLIIENNSSLISKWYNHDVICMFSGWNLKASDSYFKGDSAAIGENHDFLISPSVELDSCVLEAGEIGYYKVNNSPLIMENTTVKVVNQLVKEDGTIEPSLGTALFLRSGDITLNNVTVTYENEAPSNIPTDEKLVQTYANNAGFGLGSGRAILIVLNSYESINLNINGGSYTGSAVGAPSVSIVENGKDIHYGSYEYNNHITISDNPTFSPETTMFDQPYENTTVIKK